jgi:hypothetical protein
MMQTLPLGSAAIQADPERTWTIYSNWTPQLCDCSYCRNFAAAVPALPQAIVEVLRSIGIDANKPNEITEYGGHKPGRLYAIEWPFIGPRWDVNRLSGDDAATGHFEGGIAFRVYPGGIPDYTFPPAERWSVEVTFRDVPWVLAEPEPD